MTTSTRVLSSLLLLLAGLTTTLAQTNSDQYAEPTVWSPYRISRPDVSVIFPKLPVVVSRNDLCSGSTGALYSAYSHGVVYEFEWHAKSKDPIPTICPKTATFSWDLFSRHVDELKKQPLQYVESDGTVAGMPAKILRSRSATVARTRWLIWLKDSWIEFGMTYRPDIAADENRFVEGLKLHSSFGQDPDPGADAVRGDTQSELLAILQSKEARPIAIASKPRPIYTADARKQNVVGTVLVHVTFLANGGIGSVAPVKGLPSGLTEAAIDAARKITFLPATRDGNAIDLVKTIEYTFSIY